MMRSRDSEQTAGSSARGESLARQVYCTTAAARIPTSRTQSHIHYSTQATRTFPLCRTAPVANLAYDLRLTLTVVRHGAGAALLHGQARLRAIEELDPTLFVDRQCRGLLGGLDRRRPRRCGRDAA